MELTIASMDLEDDQANTKNIELNEIVVRGGQLSHKSVKHVVSVILISTMFFLSPPDPHLIEGLWHYITPSRPSWSYTYWSFKPSLECLSHQTPSLVFLWVVVVKATLFKSLLNINAAKKVDAMHSMR